MVGMTRKRLHIRLPICVSMVVERTKLATSRRTLNWAVAANGKTHELERSGSQVLHRPNDGMDGPALPILPPPAHAPCAHLYRDDHHRRGASRTSRAAHGL